MCIRDRPREDQSLLETYQRLDRFDQNTIRQLMERLLFQQDRKEKARRRQAYRPLCLYAEAASAGVTTPMADHAEQETVYALEAKMCIRDRVPAANSPAPIRAFAPAGRSTSSPHFFK